jgi:general secretion pathway protein A
MYEKFFGLAELPFTITPDPRYLWYSEQHQEAKSKITFCITRSVSPVYLLARIGTGKTTLARRIFSELDADKSKRVVFVYAPKLPTTNAFLRFIMSEFGVPTDRAYDRSLKAFEMFLIEQFKKGISPVLLIDEAQNMTRDMLLLVQHLFNFSTDKKFLVQMALFAQPEFKEKLDRLPALDSRMRPVKLSPLNRKQTAEMMQFRWTVAGGKELPFEVTAIDEVFRISQGIPRAIVKLVDEALIKAVVLGQRIVIKDHVVSATAELSIGQL